MNFYYIIRLTIFILHQLTILSTRLTINIKFPSTRSKSRQYSKYKPRSFSSTGTGTLLPKERSGVQASADALLV